MAGHKFPSIVPSQRKYTPGVYPTQEFQSLNGSVTTMQYGNQKVDSKLELTFTNISDGDAWLIFENYEDANGKRNNTTGERDWVDIPLYSGPLGGIGNLNLRKQMWEQDSGPNLRYRYESPPTITSTFPGRSTVQVVLRGYLDGANSF